jgi:protoheme IX farnesyltransferase
VSVAARIERQAVARPMERLRDFVAMTKPRITMLVVVTTWVGFFAAAPAQVDLVLLIHTLLGVTLVCSGSSALNQVVEVEQDRAMVRTRKRPLAAGRLDHGEALFFGAALSVVGLLHLAVFTNLLAAFLCGITLGSYLFLYTPLKRVTWLSTTIGAVPGALPPMIGWAASQGSLGIGAWTLFTIQLVWQLPHFYAIAWMYRDDYRRAGFRVLSTIDPHGRRTGIQSASWCAVLLPVSLILPLVGLAGWLYTIVATLLGLGFLIAGMRLALAPTGTAARRVFLLSILYLPLLFGFLVLDIYLGV